MPPRDAPEPTGDDDADHRALSEWITWHWTTYSHSAQSQALKEAIKAELNLTADAWNPEGVTGDSLLIGRLREIVRRMYDDTQRSLRTVGQETAHLYRGVELPPDQEYLPTVLESWSTDLDWAKRFARGPFGDILEDDIAAGYIFMWHGGPGWRSGFAERQSEYIVLSEVPDENT